MNQITLELKSAGRSHGTLALSPVQQLRLRAFAKVNRRSLASMVGLCIDFAVAEDGEAPNLHPADEWQILEYAANLLVTDSQPRKQLGKGSSR